MHFLIQTENSECKQMAEAGFFDSLLLCIMPGLPDLNACLENRLLTNLILEKVSVFTLKQLCDSSSQLHRYLVFPNGITLRLSSEGSDVRLKVEVYDALASPDQPHYVKYIALEEFHSVLEV